VAGRRRSAKTPRKRPGLRGRPLRTIAWSTVAAGIALPLVRRKLRVPPTVTAAVVAAAPPALAIAMPRTRRRDVALYALHMWAYVVVHELPYDDPERLERRVHVDYPIAVDRALFGTPPTLALQRALGRPGRSTVLDYGLVCVHWAWFLQPHATAAWVLWRHPDRFPQAATMLATVFDVGALGYVAVPTAPPWWAAERGRYADPRDPHAPAMRRIMAEVGQRVWGGLWPALYRVLGGNPLAAMPSLHFGTSVMAASVLDDFGLVPALLGWGYASVLGFALVYLGEHYVVDLAAGLALALGVRGAAPLAAPVAARLSRTLVLLEKAARA
jgi:hypothetical protein